MVEKGEIFTVLGEKNHCGKRRKGQKYHILVIYTPSCQNNQHYLEITSINCSATIILEEAAI